MRQKVGEAHALTARSEPVRSHTILVAVACVGRVGKKLGRRARRLVHDIVEALEIDICFFAAVAFKLSTDGSRALREACVDAVRRHFHVVNEAISCVLRLAADELAHLSSILHAAFDFAAQRDREHALQVQRLVIVLDEDVDVVLVADVHPGLRSPILAVHEK